MQQIEVCPKCHPLHREIHTAEELIQFHPLAIPECPACQEFRIHTPEDWKFHPGKGMGSFSDVRVSRKECPK